MSEKLLNKLRELNEKNKSEDDDGTSRIKKSINKASKGNEKYWQSRNKYSQFKHILNKEKLDKGESEDG